MCHFTKHFAHILYKQASEILFAQKHFEYIISCSRSSWIFDHFETFYWMASILFARTDYHKHRNKKPHIFSFRSSNLFPNFAGNTHFISPRLIIKRSIVSRLLLHFWHNVMVSSILFCIMFSISLSKQQVCIILFFLLSFFLDHWQQTCSNSRAKITLTDFL